MILSILNHIIVAVATYYSTSFVQVSRSWSMA
jgi:hypothetical protein